MLKEPRNGKISIRGSPVNEAVYSCNHGYNLVGGSRRTCVDNGTWTGSSPYCSSKFKATSPIQILRSIDTVEVVGILVIWM